MNPAPVGVEDDLASILRAASASRAGRVGKRRVCLRRRRANLLGTGSLKSEESEGEESTCAEHVDTVDDCLIDRCRTGSQLASSFYTLENSSLETNDLKFMPTSPMKIDAGITALFWAMQKEASCALRDR